MAPDRPPEDEEATSHAFEREDAAGDSGSSTSSGGGESGLDDQEVVHICKRCMTARPAAEFCTECGEPLVPIRSVRDSYLGEVVGGKYKLVEQIGSGGMGEVYLGINEPLDQRVAVKFLSQKYCANEQIIMRFLNEARSYCRVNHPNAVTLLDYGQHGDGALYIITEYVEGISLTDAIDEHGPLEPAKALSVTMQCCEVLEAAHDEGVIHRDLKPDNIMLMPASQHRYAVKVLDFGIAKIVDDERAALTKTGSVFGTPEFMSPEQAEGKTADPRSDLYALGIILFYTSTGQLPFEADSQFAVLEQQINEEPPRPGSVTDEAEVPEAIERIIEQCLQKDRQERFEDADRLYEALEVARSRIGSTESSPAITETKGGAGEGPGTIQLTDLVGPQTEPDGASGGDTSDVGSIDGRADTPLASDLEGDLREGAGSEPDFEFGGEFDAIDMNEERYSEPFELPTPDRSKMPIIGAVVALLLTGGIVGWQVWSTSDEASGGGVGSGAEVAATLSAEDRKARRRLSEAHVWLDEATVSQARRSYEKAQELVPEAQTSGSFQLLAETTKQRIEKVEATRNEFVAAADGDCQRAEDVGDELGALAPEVTGWIDDRVEKCSAEAAESDDPPAAAEKKPDDDSESATVGAKPETASPGSIEETAAEEEVAERDPSKPEPRPGPSTQESSSSEKTAGSDSAKTENESNVEDDAAEPANSEGEVDEAPDKGSSGSSSDSSDGPSGLPPREL